MRPIEDRLRHYRADLLEMAANDPHQAVDKALDLFDDLFPEALEWHRTSKASPTSSSTTPPRP